MAYPARNFEKDPSKRVKGWYMVPGKGRRYWDGKAFKYSSPDGTTNVKDMVGDRIRGLVGRIPRGSQSGTVNRRGRKVSPNKGKSNPVESGSPSQSPNQSQGGANNPGTSRTEKKDPPKPLSTTQKPQPKPKAKQTGDKGKDMGAWAKANQKLAQRMVDRYKDRERKPSGYASVVKALKEIKAKNVKPKSDTKVA